MSSIVVESHSTEAQRDELSVVLKSPLFLRSPSLGRLLSHLCEKTFSGESGEIKEYSVAVDVFGRQQSFDQDTDSIVRVQANRLRKRLADYYGQQGASHKIHITIPVGQYVPLFVEGEQDPVRPKIQTPVSEGNDVPEIRRADGARLRNGWRMEIILMMVVAVGLAFLVWQQAKTRTPGETSAAKQSKPEPTRGPMAGEEVRILSGANRSFVDRSGKMWNQDNYFTGGTPVRSSVRHIWRTLDPSIYRNSRQGDFSYDIPLKRGIYELHLHFAETFYGPEEAGGGGEGSRLINVFANGKVLLTALDVIADAGGARTADVKVFTDIIPAKDGFLHLKFSSAAGGRAMVSGIELLIGLPGKMRPVRIVARDVPYYSNDSHWWSADVYFRGGQLAAREDSVSGTDDPELYETERWGHFSYAVPVVAGEYILVLHFIERGIPTDRDESSQSTVPGKRAERRIFNVFCNGKSIIRNLDILEEVGEDRPLIRKFAGLEANAQDKLLLEFEPVTHYATLSAVEVLPQ